MTSILINNFGGEFPRVPARNLPAGAAQLNRNLSATSPDFRPLLGYSKVEGVTVDAGTKSLYRYQRQTDGSLLTNLSEGWVHSTDGVSYVRGQVADDVTERTYITTDDGSQPPRVRDNTGASYTLGIPRPPKPEVALLPSIKMTRVQAIEFRDKTLVPTLVYKVMSFMDDDQFTSRFTPTGDNYPGLGYHAGTFRAGITKFFAQDPNLFEFFPSAVGASKLSQRGYYEPWNMIFRVNSYQTNEYGIGNPQLGAVSNASGVWLGFTGALPFWGTLDLAQTRAYLKTVAFLEDGVNVRLWTDAQVEDVVVALDKLTSPDHYETIRVKRTQLDGYIFDYAVGMLDLINDPVVPTKSGVETQTAFDQRLAAWKSKQTSAVTAMVTAQSKAIATGTEIEAFYANIVDNLTSAVATWAATLPLEKTDSNEDGLFVLSPEPLIDTRFYLTTYVTAWGEESALSEPSDMLSVDHNDLVVINEPSRVDVASGRNITKYRIYRSNTGSSSASFQLVTERSYGDHPVTAVSDTTAVGVDYPSFGEKSQWRDAVATWQIHKKRGLVSLQAPFNGTLDTSKLVIGDTVTQANSTVPPTYSITKTWNGGAWVPQHVPSLASVRAKACFVDGVYSVSLGETCPTTTWLPPPYRFDASVTPLPRIPAPKGANPYLRGLTPMANGVMAGFVDNFVAFSEAYVGYAWPVEYQIPLDYPIVGLCAFGQSLLVGTRANPYIISGADPASMSAVKTNEAQACVSAKSMVAAKGGVFYASPDGYCFADTTGVQVVTTALFSNEDWQALNPASIFAVVHDSVLYFWYTGNGGGCYGMDMVAQKLTRHDARATSAFEDVVTDAVYVTFGGEIRQMFSGSRQQGQWKSGKITAPAQAPLAWVRVLADFEASPVTVNWYGDGVLRATKTLNSIEPQRLPAGRYLEHEVEVVSNNRVSLVCLASTTDELKAV